MSGLFHVAYMDGTQSEEKTQGRFYGRRRRAYNKCVEEAKRMTGPEGDYDASKYEEVLNSRVTYSESYATLHGISFPGNTFESSDEASNHFQDTLEKWEYAAAVKVRLSDDEMQRAEVSPDADGYCWAIYAWLAG